MSWTKWLTDKLIPRTGRMIKEDGSLVNQADYIQSLKRSEVRSLSLAGRTFVASYRLNLDGKATRDFVLEVPAGVRFMLHARRQTVIDGNIDWQVRAAADPGYTADAKINGKNANGEIGTPSMSNLILTTAAGTTGSVFLYEGSVIAEGQGSRSVASISTIADVVNIFNTANRPVLRFINRTNSATEIVVNIVFSEESIE